MNSTKAGTYSAQSISMIMVRWDYLAYVFDVTNLPISIGMIIVGSLLVSVAYHPLHSYFLYVIPSWLSDFLGLKLGPNETHVFLITILIVLGSSDLIAALYKYRKDRVYGKEYF